jgi:predicted amino acid-binding ACT domain protein
MDLTPLFDKPGAVPIIYEDDSRPIRNRGMSMARDFVISVMSRDRVGIVAGVTRAILDLQGNVEALSQTVLRGYFTIILTASFSEETRAERVQAAIEKSGSPGELAVSVKPRDPDAARTAPVTGDQFVLTIMGRDRPGVISRLSSYLSSRGINIVDLYAYIEGDNFVMLSQVMIPTNLDVRQLQIDLEGLPLGSDLVTRLQHEDIFVATSEIEFRHKGTRPR